jgi:hypothetical protein
LIKILLLHNQNVTSYRSIAHQTYKKMRELKICSQNVGLIFRREEENLNIFTMTSFLRAKAVITKKRPKDHQSYNNKSL